MTVRFQKITATITKHPLETAKTLKKLSKSPQKTLKNSQKTLKKPL
jgi:hypothetical protein